MLQSHKAFSTRRQFLNRIGLLDFASPLRSSRRLLASGNEVPTGGDASSSSMAAIKNRAPLASNAFYKLPLGSIRFGRWLKRQFEIQANGLSGQLDETWADVGPQSGWLGRAGEPWEHGPYFVDGLLPLAYLLKDARLKNKAQRFVHWTLDH